MANPAVDWTVDRLLSGVASLNVQVEHAQNTIRTNRSGYMEALRSLPQIQDVGAREALRRQLGQWIQKQVAIENRFAGFKAEYNSAKARVKTFLTQAGISPPGYLGAAPVVIAVPVLIWGAVAAGLITIGIIIAMAVERSRSLGVIQDIAETARSHNWTAQQTSDALEAARQAIAGTQPDPGGFRGVLQSALPLVVLVGALMIFGPALKRKFA